MSRKHSVASLDPKQENRGEQSQQLVVFDEEQANEHQLVLYEANGEQTQQLVIYNEEAQANKPDPDGLTSSDHMITAGVSIGTDDNDEGDKALMLEEGGRPVYIDDPPMRHSRRRTRR